MLQDSALSVKVNNEIRTELESILLPLLAEGYCMVERGFDYCGDEVIFIASDEVFPNRVAYGRERARKQLLGLKEWLLQSGYVDENTKRLTSEGAKAIVKYLEDGGAEGLWSVSELEGLKLEFWIVIADSRAVIEDPKNDIYYIWVDVKGVTGIWGD